MNEPSVRRALYVLFAKLLSGPVDAELYARLQQQGLRRLAEAQGVDLTSDLLDESDAATSASELRAEYERLAETVSLRASDYAGGTDDPVVALAGFLREHKLALDASADLPVDHLSVALGVMGELAGQAEESGDEEAVFRARAFFRRHIEPWALRALAEVASNADRRFYRGIAAMISAFLESERAAA